MTDLLEDVAIVTGSNFEGSCICTFQSPFFFPDTSHVVPFPTIRFAREHIDVTKDELRCLTFLSLCSVLFPTVVHVPPTVICNPLQTGALAFNQLQPTNCCSHTICFNARTKAPGCFWWGLGMLRRFCLWNWDRWRSWILCFELQRGKAWDYTV